MTNPSIGTLQDLIVYYVVAFLVGYRESVFRDLVKRATDLILQPGGPAEPPTPAVTFLASGAAVLTLDMGSGAPGAAPATVTVDIANTGKAPLTTPFVFVTTTDPAGAVAFTISVDNVSGQGDLLPGTSRSVTVSFQPPTAGQKHSGVLTLSSPALAAPATLALVGG